MKFKALISLKPTKAGGRQGGIVKTYRPSLIIKTVKDEGRSDCVFEECEKIEPGNSGIATINVLHPRLLFPKKGETIEKDMTFDVAEGPKIIGIGIVMEIIQ
jgi:translation elongation factor EF-Tu-like GTPase